MLDENCSQSVEMQLLVFILIRIEISAEMQSNKIFNQAMENKLKSYKVVFIKSYV